MLIKRGAMVNIGNSKGNTSVHGVVRVKDAKCIALVLEADGDVTATNEDGDTPLHLAAQNNDLSAITMLIDNGASTNAANGVGDTSLHISCRNQDEMCLKKLLEHEADPAQQNLDGMFSFCSLAEPMPTPPYPSWGSSSEVG
jgi:ankyrin repeat protein